MPELDFLTARKAVNVVAVDVNIFQVVEVKVMIRSKVTAIRFCAYAKAVSGAYVI